MNLCTWKPMARFFSRKKGHLLADDCEGTMHSRDHAFSGYNTFEPLWNTRGRFVRIIIRLHCQITTAVKRVCKDWPRWGLNIFSYFGDSTLTHCPWPLHGRWFDCWLFNNLLQLLDLRRNEQIGSAVIYKMPSRQFFILVSCHCSWHVYNTEYSWENIGHLL
jgi:hypothetical protein